MATAIDPICKMDVDIDNPSGGESEHDGETYYFCAPGCKVIFDKDPNQYLTENSGVSDDTHGHEHGHDHGPGGHSHGHHMPEREEPSVTASKPGFLARLFGKK